MIVLTGASGFVGRAVVRHALARGLRPLRAAGRRIDATEAAPIEQVVTGELSATTDWSPALQGARVVVHSAARVHVMRDAAADPLSEYRRVNVEGTMRLARQAAAAGVKRFVFVSSIKVNGEHSVPGRPLRASDDPHPVDPYGVSKLEAERALRALGEDTGLEVVIVRPVIVYGPGVRANFRAMMKLLRRGLPLPFGAIHNKRSLVAIDNLADLLVTCIDHPAAPGGVFTVSDGEDLSTTELMRRTAAALGVPARLIPIPTGPMALVAKAAGRGGLAQRLFGWLQVDISETRARLGWSPPVSVDEGLRRAAESYLREPGA